MTATRDGGEGGEGVRIAGGEVGVAAGGEVVGDLLAGLVELELAFEDVEEALRGALDERAVWVELEGHHGEGGAGGGSDVHDGEAVGEAGEWRADEGVGGEEQVVATVALRRLQPEVDSA